jgi:hypothetical protein
MSDSDDATHPKSLSERHPDNKRMKATEDTFHLHWRPAYDFKISRRLLRRLPKQPHVFHAQENKPRRFYVSVKQSGSPTFEMLTPIRINVQSLTPPTYKSERLELKERAEGES